MIFFQSNIIYVVIGKWFFKKKYRYSTSSNVGSFISKQNIEPKSFWNDARVQLHLKTNRS